MLRPVTVLFTGSAIAQGIPVAASLVLARLYQPSDYGEYAWSLSIVALTALLGSGSFTQAVNLPREQSESERLAGLAAYGGAAVAAVLGMAGLVEAIGFHRFSHRMWFLPAATLLLCGQNSMVALAARMRRFGLISRSRIAQSVTSVSITMFAGWCQAGNLGLMLGYVSGQAAACLLLASDRAHTMSAIRRPCWRDLWATAVSFRDFPLWQLPSAFIDALATQAPVWLLSAFFGIPTLGQYSFATRALGTPLQLMGASFGEVFRQQSSTEWRAHGHCRVTLASYSFILGGINLPLVLALALFGPTAVRSVFGDRWALSGEFVRYLALLYALRGSIGSLSYVLILARRQRSVLVIHLAFLACVMLAGIAARAGARPVATIVTLVGTTALVYAAYALLIARASRGLNQPIGNSGPVAARSQP